MELHINVFVFMYGGLIYCEKQHDTK